MDVNGKIKVVKADSLLLKRGIITGRSRWEPYSDTILNLEDGQAITGLCKNSKDANALRQWLRCHWSRIPEYKKVRVRELRNGQFAVIKDKSKRMRRYHKRRQEV